MADGMLKSKNCLSFPKGSGDRGWVGVGGGEGEEGGNSQVLQDLTLTLPDV